MNTKALRQKILDLAIHGKLVPQNPNDEPASVLLERIKAERERLIKEGKIKRTKRSKAACDKPHYPYELPKGWCWTTLGEIGTWQSGATPSRLRKDYYGGNIPWLKTGDLNDGFITEIPESITNTALQETSVKLNPKDSVLIAMYGATIGKVGILTYPATTNQACCACTEYIVDKLYLFYFLLAYRNAFIAMGGGGAQPNISKEKIITTLMPLPPLQEQKRIVDSIGHWLSLVNSIEENKDNLQDTIKQAKSKILDLAIHGKLVTQDPTDEPAYELLKRINPKAEITCDNPQYGKLPDGWCMTNIGSLFEAVSAKRVLKNEWKNKGIPFYRAREIVQLNKEGFADKDLFVSEEHYAELKEKYGVPICDDIMISAVGSIGYTYIVRKEDVFYYKDASVLCLKNTNHWNPTFFTIWLASPFLQEQMYKNSKGTTVDTITLEKLKGYTIPFPPIKEQQRIVAKIEELFTQLDNIASSL